MTLENTQEIINGAEVLAAGRTLGLSDDETIATKMQTRRREQRQRRSERAEREGNREAAEKFLAADEAQFASKGRNRTTDQVIRNIRVEEDYPDPFGSYEERYYDDDGILRQTGFAADINQTLDPEEIIASGFGRVEREVDDQGRTIAPDDLLQERGNYVTINKGTPREARLWREGIKVDQTGTRAARSRADRPAQSRLFKNPQNANSSRRPDFASPSMRSLPNAPNPNAASEAIAEAAAMRGEVSRAAREDRFLSDVALANNYKAEAESQKIARDIFLTGGRGSMADEAIGRIAEIQKLGTGSSVGHGNMLGYEVTNAPDPNSFGMASPLSRRGEILGYFGDVEGEMVQLGEINAPTDNNALNAPQYTRGQEFVVNNLPASGKPGGTSFGYPSNINIGEQLGLFGERMRGMGLGTESFPDPRSLDEFDAAIGSILARGKQANQTFYRFDPETGKNVVSANPGIEDVLYKLRYTDAERQALAGALLQLDVGQRQDINQESKSDFANRRGIASDERIVRGFEPEGVSTPLERIKNEKVGRGKKAKGVGAELRKLSEDAIIQSLKESGQYSAIGEDGREVLLPNAARDIQAASEARESARRPFIAAPAGEPPERARFIRGKDVGKTEEELIEQYGGKQGTVAAEVQRRAMEDENLRSTAAGPDPFAESQRAMDKMISEKSAQNQYEDEAREILELERLQKEGKLQVPSDAAFGGRKPLRFKNQNQQAEVVQSVSAAPRQAPGAWMGGATEGRVVNPWQRTEPARVAPSIAPDPWAMTGPAPRPIAEAGGGGGGMKPPVAALPYGMDSEGPSQGPRNKGGYYTEPDGPGSGQKAYSGRAVGAQMRRNRRARQIGYGVGSLAGLGTVLGLTNNEEEEAIR